MKKTLHTIILVLLLVLVCLVQANGSLAEKKIILTIENKTGGEIIISAGKSIQLKAFLSCIEDEKQQKINGKISWKITDSETKEEITPSEITLSERGVLAAKKTLENPFSITVTATSEAYQVSDSVIVTVLPIVQKIEIKPNEITLYKGSSYSETVNAVLTPGTVPMKGISWTSARKGIVEIIEEEAGTISLRPLECGKTTIKAREPGGKSAVIKVNVLQPVERVVLSRKGEIMAHGEVQLEAELQPRNAGNKKLEWSLNVGEHIAVIDTKGKIMINEDATPGTRIVATCKALGAAEPVVSSIDIVIPYIYGEQDLKSFNFKKEKISKVFGIDEAFDKTYYICDQSIDHVRANEFIETSVIQLGNVLRETPKKIRIESVSGNIQLAEAVGIRGDENYKSVDLRSDILYNCAPGEAVIRFTVESEHYIYQQEKTLKIVPFQQDLLPEIPDKMILQLKPGVKYIENDLTQILSDQYLSLGQFNRYFRIENDQQGILYERETFADRFSHDCYTFDEGIYTGTLEIGYINLTFSFPVNIEVLPYAIKGAYDLKPGKEYQYTVDEPGDNTFIWSIMGEGAEIDPEKGLLKVAADPSEPNELTVIATPGIGLPAKKIIRIGAVSYSGEPIYQGGNATMDEFNPNKKAPPVPPAFSDQLFGPDVFIFSRSNLPEGVRVKTIFGTPVRNLNLGKMKQNSESFILPTKYALEFVSGEIGNMSALSLQKDEVNGFISFWLIADRLKVSGDSVYRITLENDDFFYQIERTLRVLEYNDQEVFNIPDSTLELELDKEEKYSGSDILKWFGKQVCKDKKYFRSIGYSNGDTMPGDIYRTFQSLTGLKPSRSGLYDFTDVNPLDFILTVSCGNLYIDVPCRLVPVEKDEKR